MDKSDQLMRKEILPHVHFGEDLLDLWNVACCADEPTRSIKAVFDA
jgi:hypothetical protein